MPKITEIGGKLTENGGGGGRDGSLMYPDFCLISH